MKLKILLFVTLISGLALAQNAAPALSINPLPVTQTSGILSFISQNATLLFAVLWGLCETLSLIPSIKSNSIFTLIFNTVKSLHDSNSPKT